MIDLRCGNSYKVLDTLAKNSIDTCITDPPYGLKFMGKKWDYDIPRKDLWEKVYRVLKPGAIMLVFGGTRTFHRLAVEIEDAGFEIRDCIMWLYGQGFPKSHDISKAIDKSLCATREVIGTRSGHKQTESKSGLFEDDNFEWPKEFNVTKPASEQAQLWDGWGTALKPAWEIILIAEKKNYRLDLLLALIELENKLWSLLPVEIAESHFKLSNQELIAVQNSVLWNVDELKHIREDLLDPMDTLQFVTTMYSCLNTVRSWKNLLTDHYNQTNMFTIETEIDKIIDWKTCNLSVLQITPEYIIKGVSGLHGMWQSVLPAVKSLTEELTKLIDTREHTVADFVIDSTLIPNFEPILVCMKPIDSTFAHNALEYGVAGLNIDGARISTNELTPRNNKIDQNGWKNSSGEYIEPSPLGRFPANIILDEESAQMLDDQSGISKSVSSERGKVRVFDKKSQGIENEWIGESTIRGHNDSGGASRFFYVAKASKKERNGSKHPTMKPIALMEYLCILTKTPFGGIVLDPFMGSGTTGIAAHNTGREFIGIEIDQEYFEIAKARIEHEML